MLTSIASSACALYLSEHAPRLVRRAVWRAIGLARLTAAPVAPLSPWLAGGVRRWHTHRHLAATVDRIDGHSARVAILILQFAPDAGAGLLRAAITHDLGEYVAGDVSSPLKRLHPDLYAGISRIERGARREMGFAPDDLDVDERALLGLCDGLDAYLWALHHAPAYVLRSKAWRAMLKRLRLTAAALGCARKFDAIVRGVADVRA